MRFRYFYFAGYQLGILLLTSYTKDWNENKIIYLVVPQRFLTGNSEGDTSKSTHK
jgi:hypothetical protein